jgi:cell division protein FtsA
LTGGSAKTEGLLELAEQVFHMPVRLGLPQYVTGLEETIADPAYATGVGLLIYAQQHRFAGGPAYTENTGVWGRMRKWFRGNF